MTVDSQGSLTPLPVLPMVGRLDTTEERAEVSDLALEELEVPVEVQVTVELQHLAAEIDLAAVAAAELVATVAMVETVETAPIIPVRQLPMEQPVQAVLAVQEVVVVVGRRGTTAQHTMRNTLFRLAVLVVGLA
jgi:hypothetical protein